MYWIIFNIYLVVYYTTGDTAIRELVPLHDEWKYVITCEEDGIYKVKFCFLDSKGTETQLTEEKIVIVPEALGNALYIGIPAVIIGIIIIVIKKRRLKI